MNKKILLTLFFIVVLSLPIYALTTSTTFGGKKIVIDYTPKVYDTTIPTKTALDSYAAQVALLQQRNNELQAKIDANNVEYTTIKERVRLLEEKDKLIITELCLKDKTYKFCPRTPLTG